MIPRHCRVGLALLAALTAASACFAAEPAGPGIGPGRGGIGGQLGACMFTADRALGSSWFGDYSDGAAARSAFEGHWRYQFTPWLRGQLATGFSWAGYADKHPAPFTDLNFPTETNKKSYLTLLLPTSLQIQALVKRGWWVYHVGAGPGVYRVWIENHRKVLKDPVSLKLHRGLYPGGSAELGVERFLRGLSNTSLEATVTGNLALAQRHEQFPSGFDSNVMDVEYRIGGNYYFTPGQRKTPASTTPTLP